MMIIEIKPQDVIWILAPNCLENWRFQLIHWLTNYFWLYKEDSTYNNIANEMNQYAEWCQEEMGRQILDINMAVRDRSFFGLMIPMSAVLHHAYKDYCWMSKFQENHDTKPVWKIIPISSCECFKCMRETWCSKLPPGQQNPPNLLYYQIEFSKILSSSTEIPINEAMKGY